MPFADPKVVLFLQAVIVVGLPLLLWGPLRLGHLFPLPIIQIFCGIALGPSVFKALWPEGFAIFFRPELLPGVQTLADVALVLFVFLAGCEIDRQTLQRSSSMVVRISVVGVVLSCVAGGLVAWGLLNMLPREAIAGPQGGTLLFSFAFGLCMAVTALPVLVILLRELGFNTRPIGTIALGVGGIDDAQLWLSLSVLLPFAAGGNNPLTACSIAASGGILTVLVLNFVIRPWLQKLIDRETPERLLISISMIVLFFAAALNEATQLHAAIGAFMTGLFLPDKIRHLIQDRFDAPVTLLLLPFLFLATGLKTTFSLNDATVWMLLASALVVCVGGKFVGVALTTWLSGQPAPFALTLATVLQAKGLMEIVVVTVLYKKGVFAEATFSALVLVALITTAFTVPLARLCVRTFGDAATTAVETAKPAPVPAPAAPEPAPAGAAPAGPVLVFADPIGPRPMPKSDVVIGRHSGDDIRVSDVRVSRHHARIHQVDGGYVIENLTAVRSEPNPVLVNGVEREHARLSDGDSVSLGGVVFTFRAKAA